MGSCENPMVPIFLPDPPNDNPQQQSDYCGPDEDLIAEEFNDPQLLLNTVTYRCVSRDRYKYFDQVCLH